MCRKAHILKGEFRLPGEDSTKVSKLPRWNQSRNWTWFMSKIPHLLVKCFCLHDSLLIKTQGDYYYYYCFICTEKMLLWTNIFTKHKSWFISWMLWLTSKEGHFTMEMKDPVIAFKNLSYLLQYESTFKTMY